jgi:hypothetical protein
MMTAVEPGIRYRLSRSELRRQRAYRRILRSARRAPVLCGGEPLHLNRRSEERLHIQLPVYIQPAVRRGLSVFVESEARPLLAVTRDISLHGLGLVHDKAWPHRWFVAEFDVFDERPLILLVESRWTGEVEAYSHRTGGRIAGVCRAV